MSAETQVRSRSLMLRCFTAAAAGTCAASATSWLQPVLMHDLVAERAMNDASAGLLITVEMLAMTLSSLFMARFVTRDRAQFFALGGMALALLGSAGTLMVDNEFALFALRAVVGFGLGATIMVSNIVAANFPDPDKTFAWLGAINLAFGAVAVGAYSQLQLAWPHTTPYLFLLITVAAMIPVMATLPKIAMFDHAGMAGGAAPSPGELGSRRARTALLAIVTFAIVLSSGVLWSLYAVIGQHAGLSLHDVNDAIALSIATAFVGVLAPALLGGRIGRIAPTCFALLVLAGAIFALTANPDPTTYRIAICFNVAAIYFVMPYLSGAAAAIDGGGKAAAYVSSTFFFANAVSPFIAGLLTSTIGIHFIGGMTIGTVIVSAAIFIFVERLNRRSNGAPAAMIPSLGESEYHAVEVISHA